MRSGEGVKIDPDSIPDVNKQPEVMKAAEDSGKLLGQGLSSGHDRKALTMKVQKMMMDKMQEAV